MSITGISQENSYNIQNPSRNKPVFGGYVSAFSKKLDKVITHGICSVDDSFYMQDELNKIIQKRLEKNEILGEGTFAKVLKIDSKYVLRMTKSITKTLEGFTGFGCDNRSYFGLKTYYGDYVAKFGNVQVLRNVSATGKHIPAGVPSELSNSKTSEECRKYYEETYLPLFAKLPQKAFDDVAYDFATLNLYCSDGWYRFDVFNPSNFVLVGKQIRIVDNLVKNTDDANFLRAYSENGRDCAMSTTDLMRVFLMMQEPRVECEFSENALPFRRELFKKIVLAGMKNYLPLSNDENVFCLEKVAEILCKSNNQTQQIHAKLERFAEDYTKNPKKTLKNVADYIDSIFQPKEIEIF